MYNAISDTAAADGYGYGPEGFGYGYEGSISGGDPGRMEPGGNGGPVSNPIGFGTGGMGPGVGVPGPRHGRLAAGAPGASMQGGLKPLLSQMLGLGGPQTGMQPRPRPRMRPDPRLVGGRSIGAFGPRPLPRPVPRPVAGGGTMRGGGGAPVSTPAQRGRVRAPIQRSGSL